jgi:hypothetical protein
MLDESSRGEGGFAIGAATSTRLSASPERLVSEPELAPGDRGAEAQAATEAI